LLSSPKVLAYCCAVSNTNLSSCKRSNCLQQQKGHSTQYTLRVTQDCFCKDLDFYGFPYASVVIVAVAKLNYVVACQRAGINIPEPIVPRNSIDTTACSSESMKRDENTTENEANLSTLVIFKNFMTEELFGSQFPWRHYVDEPLWARCWSFGCERSKFYDSTFAYCGTYIVVECDMNAICCNVAGSDTYLVMSDANEAVTVGVEVTRDAGNVAGEGLARCAEIPPVKSGQAEVDSDLIS
ncbi:Uncharacterized protein APZ42_005763, partial [Daphnia magna]